MNRGCVLPARLRPATEARDEQARDEADWRCDEGLPGRRTHCLNVLQPGGWGVWRYPCSVSKTSPNSQNILQRSRLFITTNSVS